MSHVMLDVETLGTSPGSVIVSIGAVTFEAKVPTGNPFYQNVSIKSQLNSGFIVDAGALKFWLTEASDQNRKDLFKDVVGIAEALTRFGTWFRLCKGEYLWSHGSTFDVPILDAAYRLCNKTIPWSYKNVRDTRTLFSMLPDKWPKLARITPKHNALDDAIYQADCVTVAYNELGMTLE